MFMLRRTHQKIVDEKNIAGLKLSAQVNQLQIIIDLQRTTIDELKFKLSKTKTSSKRKS